MTDRPDEPGSRTRARQSASCPHELTAQEAWIARGGLAAGRAGPCERGLRLGLSAGRRSHSIAGRPPANGGSLAAARTTHSGRRYRCAA